MCITMSDLSFKILSFIVVFTVGGSYRSGLSTDACRNQAHSQRQTTMQQSQGREAHHIRDGCFTLLIHTRERAKV